MPMYEYECAKCGGVFEKLEKFSDEPLKKHEGCGGKVKRLISAPGLQFKGSGWYITDYARSGSGGGAAESNGGGESSSGSPSEASADSSGSSSSSSKAGESGKSSTKSSSEKSSGGKAAKK